MKLEDLIGVLCDTGTGSEKIAVIEARLKGVTLKPDSVAAKLEGKIPSGTLQKVMNIIEHGVPEVVEPSKVDVSQFVTKGELSGFRAALVEASEAVQAMAAKLEEMAEKQALAKEERAALVERIATLEQLLTESAPAAKGG